MRKQHSADSIQRSAKDKTNIKAPFTAEGAKDAEESKTLPLSHGKTGTGER